MNRLLPRIFHHSFSMKTRSLLQMHPYRHRQGLRLKSSQLYSLRYAGYSERTKGSKCNERHPYSGLYEGTFGLTCGVTLIELLVTMSIIMLIVVILYSVFNVSLRGWKKADNMLQVTTAARVALEQMSKEIASARVIAGSNSYYCLGFDESSGSGWRPDSIGDEFYFIGPLNPGEDDHSDLCEVGYWLDGSGTADKSDDVLRRFYLTDDRKVDPTPEFDFDFSTPAGRTRSDEFVFNVTNLEFDFFDADGNLFDTWDSRTAGGPPAKIKIRITVALGKGTSSTNPEFVTKNFTTIVSLNQ